MSIIYRGFRRLYITIRNLSYKLYSRNIKIGKNLNYRADFRINCISEGELIIGDNVFFNNDCSINTHKRITIGDDCIFGENVKIYDHNHVFSIKDVPVYAQGYIEKEVQIGRNCWIGSNVVILPGTIIEDNVVIGAGAVIKGIIPSNNVVMPNRDYVCKPISYRSERSGNQK